MGAAFEFVQFVLFLRIKTRGNPIIKRMEEWEAGWSLC